MPKRKYAPQTIERACALRERQGLSVSAIASEVGCPAKTLEFYFLKLGVDPPKPARTQPDYHLQCPVIRRGDHLVRAFTPQDDARLLALEAQRLTPTQIARALGRTPNSIKGRLMTLARREERAAAGA